MAAQGAGRRIHLRLFLEGIEVPVIGAMVSSAIGSGASANIQVVPTDRAMELKPRTLVHLFYLDEGVQGSGPVAEEDWGRSQIRGEYRLMFCGEIVSMSTQKQSGSRSLTFQCLDTSSYWDTTYQYMMQVSNGESFVERPAAFLGASDNLFDNLVNDPSEKLRQLLTDSPKTPDLQDATGLLGGVIRVLESVGGVPGVEGGANLYNTIAEMRIKNTHQIGAAEDDTSSEDLFDIKVFTSWLTDQLGGMGELITLRDVISLLNSHIYHNVVPITTPRYVLGKKVVDTVGGESAETVETNEIEDSSNIHQHYKKHGCTEELADLTVITAQQIGASPYHLAAIIDAETNNSWSTRAANRVFPNGKDGWPPSTWATGLLQFTPVNTHHLSPLTARVSNAFDLNKRSGGNLTREDMKASQTKYNGLASAAERSAYLKRINDSREIVADVIADMTAKEQFDLMISYFGKGGTFSLRELVLTTFHPDFLGINPATNQLWKDSEALPDNVAAFNKPLKTVGEYWKKIKARVVPGKSGIDDEVTTKDAKTYDEKRKGARLLTQVIRPDVWFVAPPRCNVIFPEQQLNVNYSRDYMREVTRLQLRTNLEIISDGTSVQDALMEFYAYSPRVQEFADEFEKNAHLQKLFLMSHEKFTGIIPRFERMGQVNFHLNKESALAVARTNQGLSSEENALRKHAADFNFFRHRFSSRSLEASLYFNPYLALGFPGVVIQRGFTPPNGMSVTQVLDKIQESASGFESNGSMVYLPTAMVGLVSSLNHSISQSGGTTQASFTQVRAHRTADGSDDDFLNVFIGDVERSVNSHEIVTSFTFDSVQALLDDEQAKWLYATSDFGLREDPRSVTRTMKTFADAKVGSIGPNKGTISKAETSSNKFHVLGPGYEVNNPDVPPLPPVLEGHDSTKAAIFFDTITYTETVKLSKEEKERFKAIKLKTPVEMALFPPWFSEVYFNDKIGEKVYQPFFGTGSIVDDQVFQIGKKKLGEISSTEVTVKLGDDAKAGVEKKESDDLTIKQNVSIAQAVDALATIYGYMKSIQGDHLDITKFIQRYTFRPVARLEEVLGSNGSAALEYDSNGELTKGREGFHSRAVAPLSGLKGLAKNPNQALNKASGGSVIQLDPDLDPRPERQAKVMEYRRELLGRQGDLGRGLEG